MRVRPVDRDPDRCAASYPRWNLGNRRRETSLALAAAHARETGLVYGYTHHPEAVWTAAHAHWTARLLLAILSRIPAPEPLLPHVADAVAWALSRPWVPPTEARIAEERASYWERYGPGRGKPPRVLPDDWLERVRREERPSSEPTARARRLVRIVPADRS